MEALLIDFNNIIKNNNLTLLEEKISPIPIIGTYLSLSVIIILPSKHLDYLESHKKEDDRLKYLNTPEFISDIKTYVFILYDKIKKLCEIRGNVQQYLPEIMSAILINIPNDVLLWIGIDIKTTNLQETIDSYITEGYNSPFVCKVSPFGYNFQNHGLCMLKENNIIPSQSNISNDIKYVLTQFLLREHEGCEVKLQLNSDTIKYLRNLTNIGSTVNKDGNISQKEVAGVLEVNEITPELIHILEIKYESIIYGEEEGVEIAKGLYNFHSHPITAYKKHNVKLAWPSAQDYVGFILAVFEDYTICHFVVGVEGLYIVSMTTHWLNNIAKLDKSVGTFIIEKYDFCYQPGQTSEWYTRKVNTISYNGFPLFDVKYIPWDRANEIFTVKYRKINDNCFSSENILLNYDNIYY